MKVLKAVLLLVVAGFLTADAHTQVSVAAAKKHASYKNAVVYKATLTRTASTDTFLVHLGSNGAGIPIWGAPDNNISALFVTPSSGAGKDTIGVTVSWQVTGKRNPSASYSAQEWLTVGAADSLGRAPSDAAVFEQSTAAKGAFPYLRLVIIENGAKSTTTGDLDVYITVPDRVVHAR
ncbi:MAG: hypothetical protein Q9Q40_14505 [Acidobacteriota bacterium]|nr:hypothetical protein [Acidobacteriota bacterium]